MSFFGSGSQGSIRYQLIVDDMGANAKIGTFKNSLTQLAPATQTANRNMGVLANNFKATSGSAQDMIVQHNKLGSTIKTNISNFSNLAIGLSATATSSLQLAAGFRDYNDAQIAVERVSRKLSLAQESLTKAQDKLESLQKKGITSGKDYAQAQLDVQQAQQQVSIQTQLLGESQERLFDSQSQFVVSIVPTVLGAIGTLGAAWKDMGGTMTKLKTTIGGLGGSFKGLGGGILGIVGPAGLAAGAALLIIDRLEKVKENLKLAGVQVTQTSKSFVQAFIDMDLAKFNSEMKQSMLEFDNVNKLMRTTPLHLATTDWQTLKKEIEAAGGVFDKNNRLMDVTIDHVFDLGASFKDSSTQWIIWMTNYRKAGESNEEILARLKKAKFDDTTATKIAAAANEDYNNSVKAQTTTIKQAIPTIEEFNQRFAHGVEDVDLQSEALDNYVGGFSALAVALAKNEQATKDVTDANIGYLQWLNHLSPAQQQYIKLLEQGNKSAKDTIPTVEEFNQRFRSGAKDVGAQSEALDDWTNQTAPTVTAAGDLAAAFDKMGFSIENVLKKWTDFQQTSREGLLVDFKIKSETDQVDKWKKQFIKNLPDKIEKKLKLELKTEVKEQSFKDAASQWIAGLSSELLTNDQLANAVAASLAKSAPNEQARKAFQAMITGPDTGKQLLEYAQNQINKESPLIMPVQGEWQGFEGGGFDFGVPGFDTAPKKKKGGKNVSGYYTPQGYRSNKPGDYELEGNSDWMWNMQQNTDTPLNNFLRKLTPEQRRRFDQYANSHPDLYSSGGAHGGLTSVSNKTIKIPDPNHPGHTITYTPGMEGDPNLGGGQFNLATIQTLQKAIQSLTTYGTKNLAALAKASQTNFNTMANYAKGAMTIGIQPLQIALQSLATYGVKNIAALAKGSKTNFNTMANYAAGAMIIGIQPLQIALQSLGTYGVKNIASLAKSSKTNFNTVANYSNGATESVQTFQKAVDSMTKFGVKNLVALGKASKTNFNTVANYADGATDSLKQLAKAFIAVAVAAKKAQSAVRSAGGSGSGLAHAQHGMHTVLEEDTLIQAHRGERVDIGPGARFGSGAGGGTVSSGNQVFHIHILNNDRETIRSYKRQAGANQFVFGPR